MIPILLKILPVGFILKALVYGILITAVLGGLVLFADPVLAQQDQTDIDDDEEDEFDPWESVIASGEFDNLTVYHVEYDHDDDVARVYLEADQRTSVTLTDGTRQETGFHNRVTTTVQGQEVMEVILWDSHGEHVTVAAEGELWSHFGPDSEIRYDDEVDYAIVLGPVAGVSILVLLIGLHQYSARYRSSAKNPIEG